MPTVHIVLKNGKRYAVAVESHSKADELLGEFDKPQSVVRIPTEEGCVEVDSSELRSAKVSR
jgi:hypothetical protein